MKRCLLVAVTLAGLSVVIAASQNDHSEPASSTASTELRAFGAIHPRISPDGRSIVFSYQGAIWRTPRTGGTMTRLTDGKGFDVEPVWSPDGKTIAYLNSPSMGAGELKLIDAETGDPLPLPQGVSVKGTYVFFKLDFHPDGKRVFGGMSKDGKDRGIASLDLKTGQVKSLARPQRSSRYRYALSNDGKWLIYTTNRDQAGQQGGNNGPQADIWKVSTDGGEPTKITRFPSRIHDVCWSADDRALYVVSELGGVYYDLWQISLANPNRPARQVTTGQADETRPSVSRDGRWLLYLDNRKNCTAMVLRDLANGVAKDVSINEVDFRRPTGSLSLTVADGDTGKPTTARISIEDSHGKYFAPPGELYRVLGSYSHFYGRDRVKFTLPTGRYRLRSLRGPEYRTTYRDFEIKAGQNLELNVNMKRWTHRAANGWYSGENHIHANYGYGEWYNTPETMLLQSAGEDLNVCNFMVANSDTDGVFDRQFFRGRADSLSTDETILYWNQEFRSTIWGHMTLVNLKQVVEPVFTGFKDTTNPWDIPTNSDVADRTHLQGGHVNYTHVAQRPEDPYQNPYTGKGIPIDVALGKIDSLDINATYAGTVPLWYRLLNCGFRLPASAGTDCFLNRIRSRLPGGHRVYVRIDGPLQYDKWIEGLRAGRSFVTNGPMLEFEVNNKRLGETIRLTAAGKVEITAKATAQFPLVNVEVIFNGKVIAKAELSDDKLTAVIKESLPVNRSGWMALRATGKGHLDHPFSTQYAHTNPVYVQIGDQPTASREDAEYFLKWIDRLALAIRIRDRIPSDKLKQHVRDSMEAARVVYRQIAEADKQDAR